MNYNPVVVRFGRLGDTILLQPLLRKLQLRFGQPCWLVALGGWPATLYSAQPEVCGFIQLRSQHGPLWLHPERWRATLSLRSLAHSPVYICEPELRARTKIRPMLKLAGISEDHCRFIEDSPMLEGEHWADWLLRFGDTTPSAFFERYGNTSADVASAPQLEASSSERIEREEWMRAQGLLGHPIILLQPSNRRTMRWNGVRDADDDNKSWPAERWVSVGFAIREQLPQAKILLCGSAGEALYLRDIMDCCLPGAAPFRPVALPIGRLKALLEIAHSMISVDTGPAHLAAAVGCPLVVLFGERSPKMWAPRSGSGSGVAVVGGTPATPRVSDIAVETVAQAWRDLAPYVPG